MEATEETLRPRRSLPLYRSCTSTASASTLRSEARIRLHEGSLKALLRYALTMLSSPFCSVLDSVSFDWCSDPEVLNDLKMEAEDISVSAYLRSHPQFLQEWLERNADLVLLEAVKAKWDEAKVEAEAEASKNKEKPRLESLEVPKPSEGYVMANGG